MEDFYVLTLEEYSWKSADGKEYVTEEEYYESLEDN